MNGHCLLCFQELQSTPTWTRLLLRTHEQVICDSCHSKFEKVPPQNELSVVSLFEYNEAMKEFLHQYKFLQDVALAKVFRREIHQALAKEKAIVVPIPMHPKKLLERTFSQVDCLLQEAQIPFVHLLEKTTETSQSSKSKIEREASTPLFRLKENAIIHENSYILVDDIVTTGTTLNHAKDVLQSAGAKDVRALTLIKG